MFKVLKEIFFKACCWFYFNWQIIFVLSCMIIGGVAGWFISGNKLADRIFVSILCGICSFLISCIIVPPKINHVCSKKEKTKKAMPVQNETN